MNDDQPPPLCPHSNARRWRRWIRHGFDSIRERICGSNESAALREAVEELIEDTESGGTPVQAEERELLTNVLELREKHIRDCMVPRADIVAMDDDSTMQDLIDTMVEKSHSRIPIYHGTLDDTLGLVHIKDVLVRMARHETFSVRDLLRPMPFVAPSMPATRLLMQMRQTRRHMAMVVDEFGGIDGLVTIEDLVEEIVGNIEDEHDAPEVPLITLRPDGSIVASARLPIEDLERQLRKQFLAPSERETIDTLGGYVAHLAGHMLQSGEKITGENGVTFEVLENDNNRQGRIKVHIPALAQ